MLVRPEGLAHDAPAQRISLPADEADVSVLPSLAFGLRAREQRNAVRAPASTLGGHAHAARDDDGGELAALGGGRCGRGRWVEEGRGGDGGIS